MVCICFNDLKQFTLISSVWRGHVLHAQTAAFSTNELCELRLKKCEFVARQLGR